MGEIAAICQKEYVTIAQNIMQTNKSCGKIWESYSLRFTLLIMIFMAGIFVFVFIENKEFLQLELEARAEAYFRSIVLTRRWNAVHGGVFVVKSRGIKSNPYLENPDITTVDGRIFTMKNPALMTREMSGMAAQDIGCVFHITSLTPLNPKNAPLPFEINMLKSFEQGADRAVLVEHNDRSVFRFMAPLRVEKSCLLCHAKQGYHVADIRGGISISFDISAVEKEFIQKNIYWALLGCIGASSLLGLLHKLTGNLKNKLQTTQQEIEKLAVTDELTGLYNRRYFFHRLEEELSRASRHENRLSLIIMDIDYFKTVNDNYGHLTGDLLLRHIGMLLKQNARISDITARVGGEEFVILPSGTKLIEAQNLAEKLRSIIAETSFQTDTGGTLSVTASFGCASITAGKNTTKSDTSRLLKMADNALYTAKAHGRNKVVCVPEQEEWDSQTAS